MNQPVDRQFKRTTHALLNADSDLIFIPNECPQACPVFQASQTDALNIAAEAQSLFQRFLKCLHDLDGAVANHFADKLHCDYINDLDQSPDPHMQMMKIELQEQKAKTKSVEQNNQHLLVQYDELRAEVDQLQRELSKRRSQYNNRILIEIFKEHDLAQTHIGRNSSFFDLVQRSQLQDFVPFIRNIILGPAVASQFDQDLAVAIAPYLDEEGAMAANDWQQVLDDQNVREIMNEIATTLFERSQRKTTLQSLLQRKSPVHDEHIPGLINIFQAMGPEQARLTVVKNCAIPGAV